MDDRALGSEETRNPLACMEIWVRKWIPDRRYATSGMTSLNQVVRGHGPLPQRLHKSRGMAVGINPQARRPRLLLEAAAENGVAGIHMDAFLVGIGCPGTADPDHGPGTA